MIQSILLTGVGGQGVVTMANMISGHLQRKDAKVTLIHSTGMAQRGGRVTSEIRFSKNKEASFGPRISSGGADFVIGMDMAETINSMDFMKEGGCLIYNEYTLIPSQAVTGKTKTPDSQEVQDLFRKLCSSVNPVEPSVSAANIYLLGAFSSICRNDKVLKELFEPEDFAETLRQLLSKRVEENLDAFRKGVKAGSGK